jgi:hypothetical protein
VPSVPRLCSEILRGKVVSRGLDVMSRGLEADDLSPQPSVALLRLAKAEKT